MGMWDYAAFLPLRNRENIVSLGEGGTPLIESRRDYGCNSIGSSNCRIRPVHKRIAPSASPCPWHVKPLSIGCSWYRQAARAWLALPTRHAAEFSCTVIIPEGTPHERLLPMQAHGARLFEGDIGEIALATAQLRQSGWCDMTTERKVNPYQAEAPKTIAYEIAAQLAGAPDWVVVPAGGGATIAGIAQGFRDLLRLGRIDRLPRLACIVPRAFNALEVAMTRNLATQRELAALGYREDIATVARNLKCTVPADGAAALAALRESNGIAFSVTDEEALAGQSVMARTDGIFCEPSSAVLSAAIERLAFERRISRDDVVVGVVTGSGLREVSAVGPLRLERLEPGLVPSRL